MAYHVLQINKMINLANDSYLKPKKRQHPDFQFKPARVGELLTKIGAPPEVVLVGIGNELLDGPVETLTQEDLRDEFGDCVARMLMEVREPEVENNDADWLERRRNRIEQSQQWSLPICVVVAAKTLSTLRETENGLRYVAAGLLGISKYAYFAQYGTGSERMCAYNRLLLDALVSKLTPQVEETQDFNQKQMELLDKILRFLCQEIDQAIGRIWPGLYLEDAERIFSFSCNEECVCS